MNDITELFDTMFMKSYDLTDDQYDYICENATDEELDVLTTSDFEFVNGQREHKSISFSIRRRMIEIIKKYKTLHANNNSDYDF